MIEDDSSWGALAERAQQWIETYGTTDDGATVMERWQRFASAPTTLTLFGAYDSGKSSLLRRLLVDSDLAVPEWLTISARHETFAASDVAYHDIIIRDTPGVSPDSVDARGEANTAAALAAIKATDVLAVVVTPQLMTAEREMVTAALNLPWAEGSLWFFISRFDEAGVDPAGDEEGYRHLAESKTAELAQELRKGLGRDLAARIFVVCPDPYGIAGADPRPDATLWDPFRRWDGMREVATAFEALPDQSEQLRSSAAARYWLSEVRQQLARITEHDEEIRTLERVSAGQKDRIEQWDARLRELRRSARNDLHGTLGRVIDQALTSSVLTEKELQTRLSDALSRWLASQNTELDALVEDVELQIEQQLERPSWGDLERVISQLAVASLPEERQQGESGVPFDQYKKPLIDLNGDLARTAKDLKERFESNTKSATRATTTAANAAAKPASKWARLLDGVDVATTVAPFAISAYELWNQYNRDAAQAEANAQRHSRIESVLQDLQESALTEVFGAFEAECDRITTTLFELDASVDEVVSSLNARRQFCDEARRGAESLLAHSCT